MIVAEPLISALFSMLRAVGLEQRATTPTRCRPKVIERAAERDRARAARDWAAADAIRDELVAAGWVVEDTADGIRVRPS